MQSVLIVCGSVKEQQLLGSLLVQTHCARFAATSAEARKILVNLDPDLVLIHAPLPDEFGDSLALNATQSSAAGVILLVQSELATQWAQRLNADGVLVLEMPLRPGLAEQALTIASAIGARLHGLQSQNQRLLLQMEDDRMVNRAKLLLIQHLRMTEPQAHYFIEQQAMNRRIPKRQVAEGILRSYEP